jgi:ABC-type uncharacterized transport system auxiliary subunit
MKTNRRPLALLVAVVVAAWTTGSCALLSKSAPIAPRYFSPERPGDVARRARKPPWPSAELRLGRVDGTSHLETRLVFRDTKSEIGYYRLRRWTEAPEQYLKRRLARVLFEEVTVDRPVVATKEGDTADAAVEAIGRALRATVDRIADRVVRELAAEPAASAGR